MSKIAQPELSVAKATDQMEAPAIMDYATARRVMVESQLRPSDVNDPVIIGAMAITPREKFLEAAQAPIAYMDRAIALGESRYLNPPLSAGLLLSRADIKSADTVLIIGAATGYLAALIAPIVTSVTAVEEQPLLAQRAQSALQGYDNVTVATGSLVDGDPAEGSYSLIIIDGAIDDVPQAIIDQLADDGRLVTGVNDNGVTRLAYGRKSGAGFGLTRFADTDIAPLNAFVKAAEYRF